MKRTWDTDKTERDQRETEFEYRTKGKLANTRNWHTSFLPSSRIRSVPKAVIGESESQSRRRKRRLGGKDLGENGFYEVVRSREAA